VHLGCVGERSTVGIVDPESAAEEGGAVENKRNGALVRFRHFQASLLHRNVASEADSNWKSMMSCMEQLKSKEKIA
jgi:hypothetical protein